MDREVAYLFTGGTIWTRLIVSLCSLRQHWGGRVAVYCATQDEIDALSVVSSELDICLINLNCPSARRGASEGKLEIIHRATDHTLYLDCDTLVTGDVSDLFAGPLVLTVNNKLRITHRRRVHLFDQFRGKTMAIDYLIGLQMNLHQRMVNAGVWSFNPQQHSIRGLVSIAYQLAFGQMPLPQTRLCEIGMQLLTGTGIEHVLLGQQWNHPSRTTAIARADVRIWHYTGSSHCRNGFPEWSGAFLDALSRNVGGLADHPDRYDKRAKALCK